MTTSLRELLLRRCSDPNLIPLIKSLKDEELSSTVLESLTKMAQNAGTKANHALNHFNSHLLADDNGHSLEGEMLRDAIGHHLSHYKAALKGGDRQIADKHLGHTVNLLHLANKLNTISGGKVKLGSGHDGYGKSGQAVAPSSWEMNYTSDKRDPKGRLAQLPKGWGRDTSNDNGMFPNYRYLEMTPHPSSGKSDVKAHADAAYPFHELTINDKYVPINDVDHKKGEFTPHEFDSHPVVGHHDIAQGSYGPGHKDDYLKQHSEFMQGPAVEQWIGKQQSKLEADPEGYFAQGGEPSKPILDKPDNSHALARPYHSVAGHPDVWSEKTAPATEFKPKEINLDDEEAPAPSTINPAHKTIVQHFNNMGHSPEKIAATANIPLDHVHEILGTKPKGGQ